MPVVDPMATPAADPLAALRDLHLPEVSNWWPPAIGWWLLAFFLIAFLWFAGRWMYQWLHARSDAKRPAKEALTTLDGIFVSNHNEVEKIQQISTLLKRFALSRFTRRQVASLHGSQWLEFLDGHLPGKQFSKGSGKVLASAPFNARTDTIDITAVIDLARRWIENNNSQSGKSGKSGKSSINRATNV